MNTDTGLSRCFFTMLIEVGKKTMVRRLHSPLNNTLSKVNFIDADYDATNT